MQLFREDNHLIYFGDALEVLKEIENESVNLIFADPPYNLGKRFSNFYDKWESEEDYAQWAYQWIDECIRILKPNGSFYVMTSTQAMPYFDLYIRKKITVISRIIWYYDSSGVQARNYFGSSYEPILHCVKNLKDYIFNSELIKIEARTGAVRKLIDYRKQEPAPYNSQKVPSNVWYLPRVRYRMDEYENHPSQKPEALLKRIILASSNLEDVILDPFSGTFTTAAVSKKLHRRSISIESQEEYLKIGLRRVFNYSFYKGEQLSSLKKPYVRNNFNGMKIKQKPTGDLFDVKNFS